MPDFVNKIDPYDLRPALMRITNAVERNLERTPEGQTLFLGFGEDHTNSAHPTLQRMTIQWLQRQGYPIAFGYECSMNIHSAILANKVHGFTDARKLETELEKTDPSGARCLTSYLSCKDNAGAPAPIAVGNLFIHCLVHGVSTRFNDTAKKSVLRPDGQRDYFIYPMHRETIKAFGEIPSETLVDVTSPQGMHIRNSVMVERSINHAKETKARVYFFHTGTFHLAGGTCNNGYEITVNPYERALLAKFHAAGQQTLAILPTSELYNTNHLTPEALAEIENGSMVPLNGLPSREFWAASEKGSETKYLNAIYEASNIDMKLHDTLKWRFRCFETVRKEGPKWVDEARQSALTPL